MKKLCIKCKKKKIQTDFGKIKSGYGNVCKFCKNIRARLWKENQTPEERRRRLDLRLKAIALRRKKTPEKFMLYRAKKRAKANGLEFNLVVGDLKIPKFCPILGIPLVVGDIHIRPYSPSLDRIDNTKGYTKDNVAVISYKANGFKGDFNIGDVERLLKYMRKC